MGTSEAYKQMKIDVKAYHEDRGDMSLDDWLKIRIKEAKDAANTESSGDGADASAGAPA